MCVPTFRVALFTIANLECYKMFYVNIMATTKKKTSSRYRKYEEKGTEAYHYTKLQQPKGGKQPMCPLIINEQVNKIWPMQTIVTDQIFAAQHA